MTDMRDATEDIYTVERVSNDQYHKIREDVRSDAVRAVRNDEEGRANHNIHRVNLVEDPQGEGVAVAKVDTKLRPGSREIEKPKVDYFNPDDMENFDDHVLDDRVGWSSSPFVNEKELDHARPKENVMAEQDLWLFDPSVEKALEGIVDLDALGADIRQARNIPKADLSSYDQESIERVEEEKIGVIHNKEALIAAAQDIAKEVVGDKATKIPYQAKTPREIYIHTEGLVEGAEQEIGEVKFAELLGRLRELDDAAMMVEQKRSEVEETSIQTFDDVLDTTGFGFPSTVSEPADAIVEHDVGTADYLFNS